MKYTIALHPTDGLAQDFSRDIDIPLTNNLTGWECDKVVELAISNFVTEINKQFDMKEFEQPLSNLMHDSLLGTFCAIFFIGVVIILNMFHKQNKEQSRVKDERISKLETRLDDIEKNDRKEMMNLIQKSNYIHEKSEKIWEEMKVLLTVKEHRK